MLAAKNGHEKCVQQLLQHNDINVSIQDKDGYNCLAIAAKNRQLLVGKEIRSTTRVFIYTQATSFGHCE